MNNEVKKDETLEPITTLDKPEEAAYEVSALDEQTTGNIDASEKEILDIGNTVKAESSSEASYPEVSTPLQETGIKTIHEGNDIKPLENAAKNLGGNTTGNVIPPESLNGETIKLKNINEGGVFATPDAKNVRKDPTSSNAASQLTQERIGFLRYVVSKLSGKKI